MMATTAAGLLLLALSASAAPGSPLLRTIPLPGYAHQVPPRPDSSAFPSTAHLFGDNSDALDSLAFADEDLRDAVAAPAIPVALQAGLRSQVITTRLSAIRAAAVPRAVRAIPYLSATMLRLSEPIQVRAAAALALGRIDDQIAVGALAEALKDPAVDVRYAAALSLGRLPADGVATRLARVLHDDPSWQPRYAAAIALGWTRKAFVADDLAAALAGDASWEVRQQAARSLQDIGTPRAAEALAGALDDHDPSVRAAAGTALAEIGGPLQRAAVTNALRDERDPSVRAILALASRRALSRR